MYIVYHPGLSHSPWGCTSTITMLAADTSQRLEYHDLFMRFMITQVTMNAVLADGYDGGLEYEDPRQDPSSSRTRDLASLSSPGADKKRWTVAVVSVRLFEEGTASDDNFVYLWNIGKRQ